MPCPNHILGEGLVCYTDIEANNYKFCDEFDGFQSCYATYDKGKTLSRRIDDIVLNYQMEK